MWSPKWPNSMEPNGRARKDTANVVKDMILASAGSVTLAKKMALK